jgi:hypothetical protein
MLNLRVVCLLVAVVLFAASIAEAAVRAPRTQADARNGKGNIKQRIGPLPGTNAHSGVFIEGKPARLRNGYPKVESTTMPPLPPTPSNGGKGNLTVEVAWTFNATWDANASSVVALQQSEDHQVMYGYAARESWRADDKNYLFALQVSDGSLLWAAELPPSAPQQCILLLTATTVTCIGVHSFVVVRRDNGNVTAMAPYPNGFGFFANNFVSGPYFDTRGDMAFFTIVNTSNVQPTAHALNLTSGEQTSLGALSVGAHQYLGGVWIMGASVTPAPKVSILISILSNANGKACATAYRATFTAASGQTIDFRLPTNATMPAVAPTGSWCPIPDLAVFGDIFISQASDQPYALSFNVTTGRYLGATTAPPDLDSFVGIFMPSPQEQDLKILIVEGQLEGLVATDWLNNGTWWSFNSNGVVGTLFDERAESFTTGGLMNPYVVRFDVSSGLNVWFTVLPFDSHSPMSALVDPHRELYIFIHGYQILVLEQATGHLVANFPTTMGPLQGEVQAEVFLPSDASGHEGNLFLGMVGQLAMITLRGK